VISDENESNDIGRLFNIIMDDDDNTNGSSSTYNSHLGPSTAVVNIMLQLLLKSDDAVMAMDVALKVYRKLSHKNASQQPSRIVQQSDEQMYDLLYRIIDKHKSNSIFIHTKQKLQKILLQLKPTPLNNNTTRIAAKTKKWSNN
jgi:hypothetical protein